MPIEFQLKKFLELPDVFNKIKLNLAKLNSTDTLQHYVNGESWKEKMKTFPNDRIVLPLFLYMDEAQINNPIGTHTHKGKQNFGYYSLPLVPNEYQSRLDNIFVASLNPGSDCKEHGNERCFNSLIETLTKLSDEGIFINISDEKLQIFFVVGIFLGDNLELNTVLGFAKSFKANFFCRFCRLKMDETQNNDRSCCKITHKRKLQ